MALTEDSIIDSIDVLGDGQIQVRRADRVLRDGVEIARTFHRHVLAPRTKTDGTWGDTDISGEEARVQAICNAVWTSSVKTAYQEAQDA